jgi:hypothetical protein
MDPPLGLSDDALAMARSEIADALSSLNFRQQPPDE